MLLYYSLSSPWILTKQKNFLSNKNCIMSSSLILLLFYYIYSIHKHSTPSTSIIKCTLPPEVANTHLNDCENLVKGRLTISIKTLQDNVFSFYRKKLSPLAASPNHEL